MPELRLLEVRLLEVRLLEVRLLEVRLLELRLPEVRLLELRLLEVRLLEVRLLEVRLPELRLPELRLPELRLLELWEPLPRLWLPPLISCFAPQDEFEVAFPARQIARRSRTASRGRKEDCPDPPFLLFYPYYFRRPGNHYWLLFLSQPHWG